MFRTAEVLHAMPKAKTVATISPKQPSARRLRDWYPYYAGFTERFVNAVIDDYLQGSESVVDPWSGTGTTTVACLRRGIASSGVDINPAATVIARARLNPKSSRQNLLDTARSLVEEAQTARLREDTDDLLALWMVGDGLGEIRALVKAIRESLTVPAEQPRAGDALGTEFLSNPACFLYTVCSGVVRILLSAYRTTNPMWIKSPRTSRSRISPERHTVRELFLQQAAGLAAKLSLTDAQVDRPGSPFKTGTASATGYRRHAFDAAITSPPYATRVDYVQGSLPELAVLGADQQYVEHLRSACTGSPKVKGVASSSEPIQSHSANDLLRAIEKHTSKGSRSYYRPWMEKLPAFPPGGPPRDTPDSQAGRRHLRGCPRTVTTRRSISTCRASLSKPSRRPVAQPWRATIIQRQTRGAGNTAATTRTRPSAPALSRYSCLALKQADDGSRGPKEGRVPHRRRRLPCLRGDAG